uniref:Gag-pol polyprotein, putative n=1 Tax=Solanum demissum TaxID=50514 RepID=Q0KIP9_SOLDE|nr:Gag-pol polyprotein, putative [Solanum demissum]
MYRDLRKVYRWNDMKGDIAGFVAKCPNCQQLKVEHQRPGGLSQNIIISTWKWEDVNMDIIVGLPQTRIQHDSNCVIIDRMTKSAHLIPIRVSYSVEDYAKLYIPKIVKLRGVPLSIISDRGTQFTPHIWKPFQKGLGTTVKISMTFHPQTNGQAERTIQTLEDILRRCRSLAGWFEVGENALRGPDLVYKVIEKRIGKVAYELDLPNELAPVFHVSLFKKHIRDVASIIPLEGLGVDESLSYEEVLEEILDRSSFEDECSQGGDIVTLRKLVRPPRTNQRSLKRTLRGFLGSDPWKAPTPRRSGATSWVRGIAQA